MAGRGPAPAETRRRSNEPARGEWVDLQPLEAPILPVSPGIDDPPGATIVLWEAWRADPVTAEWSPADIAYALETIRLHAFDEKGKYVNEVRLRMDGLGLTPKGKRDLRWRIARVSSEPAQRSTSRKASSRRARLSVVR